MNDLRQLATDLALLVSGFGFIAGMVVVVVVSLARCLWNLAESAAYVAGGFLVGIPLYEAWAMRVCTLG